MARRLEHFVGTTVQYYKGWVDRCFIVGKKVESIDAINRESTQTCSRTYFGPR
jgi:hypothetical protein